MQCPKCKNKDIKFFLRHQDTEEDTSDDANVITILCPKCGNNLSYFLADCLPGIFYEWDEENIESPQVSAKSFVEMFTALANNNRNIFPVEDTDIPILDSESSD